MAWKAVGPGAAALAGMVASKGMTKGWTKATGKEPPSTPESSDVKLGEAILWAAISGAVIGIARMIAVRQSAKFLPARTDSSDAATEAGAGLTGAA